MKQCLKHTSRPGNTSYKLKVQLPVAILAKGTKYYATDF